MFGFLRPESQIEMLQLKSISHCGGFHLWGYISLAFHTIKVHTEMYNFTGIGLHFNWAKIIICKENADFSASFIYLFIYLFIYFRKVKVSMKESLKEQAKILPER